MTSEPSRTSGLSTSLLPPRHVNVAAWNRSVLSRLRGQATGRQVGAVWMPAPQSGSPMTYAVDGKQYIVVAVSGGNYSGEYIAFALPQSEVRPTSLGQPGK